MGEPNPMKLRYRMAIQEVVRTVIVERVAGTDAVARIRDLIDFKQVPREDRGELSNLIETEISNLHEGNAVRVKVRPSQYQAWLLAQTPANAALSIAGAYRCNFENQSAELVLSNRLTRTSRSFFVQFGFPRRDALNPNFRQPPMRAATISHRLPTRNTMTRSARKTR